MWFLKMRATKHGALAQLGERMLCKHEAMGSSPIRSIVSSECSAVWQRTSLGTKGSQVRILSFRLILLSIGRMSGVSSLNVRFLTVFQAVLATIFIRHVTVNRSMFCTQYWHFYAPMAKSADAVDSKSTGEIHEGSSPSGRTYGFVVESVDTYA